MLTMYEKMKDTYGMPVFLRYLVQSKKDQTILLRLGKFPENTKNINEWEEPSFSVLA